eukprot:gene53645-71697_t
MLGAWLGLPGWDCCSACGWEDPLDSRSASQMATCWKRTRRRGHWSQRGCYAGSHGDSDRLLDETMLGAWLGKLLGMLLGRSVGFSLGFSDGDVLGTDESVAVGL